MKQFRVPAAFFLIAMCAFGSCKKDTSAVPAPTPNPIQIGNDPLPVVNAGPDQTITEPTNAVDLNGSATYTRGYIVSYVWRKISGPSSGDFSANSSKSRFYGLTYGRYEIELSVTDDTRRSARDTAVITVLAPMPLTPIQLNKIGDLSDERYYTAVASSGNKVAFAGGIGYTLSSAVDIYDMQNSSWSQANLSEARCCIGSVTVGNKMLFAGGAKLHDYFDGWDDFSTRVDIYDVVTNSWTKTELPEPMYFSDGRGVAEVSGNKAYFAFVNYSSQLKAYAYDVAANSWSVVNPSQGNGIRSITSASLGNKILLAETLSTLSTGELNVNVYDVPTNSWSIHKLTDARTLIRGSTVNNKVLFAGGCSPINTLAQSSKVEIYDGTTQGWSDAHLSRETVLAGSAALGQKLLFFGGTRVDIYNSVSNAWDIAELPQSFSDGSAITAAGGSVYATNGKNVWKIQL